MSKKFRFNFAVLVLLSPTLTMAEVAQEDADIANLPLSSFVDATSLEALGNMVITDTKVAQSHDSATQNIEVILSDTMEQRPMNNRNVAELLRYSSGQFVNVLSRNDANWGSYAGLGPKYNSYLLDGLPIDSFVDPMSLDPWAFERIEAHKGPASVLYPNYLSMDFAGNEAPLTGTTNLILKDHIDTAKTRLQAGYGSFDTASGRAYHQDRLGDFSYFVGTSEERSDYAQYGARQSWLQTVDSPGYEKTKAYGKASYAFGRQDHTLSLFVHYTNHNGDMGRPNRLFDHDYGTLNFAYNNQIHPNLHLQFKLGERYYKREFGNDNFPTDLALNSTGKTLQRIRPLDFTLSLRHWDTALLTVGVDHQQVDYQTSSRTTNNVMPENDVEAESLGVFLQEKVQWRDWVFRAGLRHNTISHDYALLGGKVPMVGSKEWAKYLWSAGIRYNVTPEFSVYANAGTSFMAPAAKQIGGSIGLPTDSGQLPNIALSPESGIGKDVGFAWQATKTLNLAARVFHNELNSAIIDNVVSTTPSQTQASNSGSATSTGIELDMRYAPLDTLYGFANLTLTHTRVKDPLNAGQNNTAIPFAPNQVGNIGITGTGFWGITISPYLHWVGRYYDSTDRYTRQEFGNYAVVNMRIQKELLRRQSSVLNLTLDLNNLSDQHYRMPWDFRDVGLNAFAAFDISF